MPEPEVETWAATQKFPPLTSRTITSARRLLKDLRVIRERGYGIDDEEREKGVRCLAAPIRNHHGDVVAAVSIAAPIDRLPRDLVGSDVAAAVVATARAISIDLGAVDDIGATEAYRAALAAHGGRK
jgi:DNA-binding IclR family transcriptional regulator